MRSLVQTRCAILLISSLLATLVTIPVLLTRLFASLKHWKLLKSGQIFKFVAYFNGKLHACEKFWSQMSSFSAKSLVNKTGIVTSVAKSDEIGKIARLVWLQISRELLNHTFCIFLRKITRKSLFKVGPRALNHTFPPCKVCLSAVPQFLNQTLLDLNRLHHICLNPDHFQNLFKHQVSWNLVPKSCDQHFNQSNYSNSPNLVRKCEISSKNISI